MLLLALAAAAAVAAPAAPVAAPVPAAKGAATTKPATAAPANVTAPTPVADRVAVLMAIDKRTGETRAFSIKPGQAVAFGALTIRLRVCETTPEWEQQSTAAFLQIDEAASAATRRRIYSGWMFAESPSLNPLQNPRYDVWVKSCTMRFPATGPDTVVASRGSSAAKASSAPKSAAAPTAEASLAR